MTDRRSPSSRPTPDLARANGRVAAALFALTAGMVGLAFAAVPFYTWFCKTTGYGGATSVASVAPDRISDRAWEVRFDANVHTGLPWAFSPEVKSVEVKGGEVATIRYRIENLSDVETRGTATFNVAPESAGGWFTKLACFCFTEQVLGPHEVIEAPVTFYVDTGADADKNLKGIRTLTLSYTFYAAEKPAPRTAAAVAPAPASVSN